MESIRGREEVRVSGALVPATQSIGLRVHSILERIRAIGGSRKPAAIRQAIVVPVTSTQTDPLSNATAAQPSRTAAAVMVGNSALRGVGMLRTRRDPLDREDRGDAWLWGSILITSGICGHGLGGTMRSNTERTRSIAASGPSSIASRWARHDTLTAFTSSGVT